MIRYVYNIVKDLEIARDIVQESFLKLWQQKQDELQGREAPWLFTVCRNSAYDYLRKKERLHISDTDLQIEIADSAPTAEKIMGEQDDEKILQSLLESLTETQKEVLHLKFQQGLSYKEISHITGMSINHVGVFIHNTVTHLKEKAEGGRRET